LDPVGWKIVLEVLVKIGTRFQEVPIVFSERQAGVSKLDTRVQVQYIAHLWKLYLFRYPAFFQFLKFCIVGFCGLLVDTAVLVGIVELIHLDPRIAAVFAFLCAVSANYVLDRFWTFNTARATGVATSYVRFVAVCVAGFFVRFGVMHLLIESLDMGSEYRYVLASIIGIFVGTIFNFMGAKFIAFSSKLNVRT
jgi:dolichol-phosphate mannosyltransferase